LSEGRGILEHMFDQPFYVTEDTPQSQALVERISGLARTENRAAAQRLDTIGDLWLIRLRDCGEREDWNEGLLR